LEDGLPVDARISQVSKGAKKNIKPTGGVGWKGFESWLEKQGFKIVEL